MKELRHKVCCIDLLNAIQDDYIHDVVSGLFFIPHNKSGCCEGVPRIKICPFCGATIKTIRLDCGWDWQTIKEM